MEESISEKSERTPNSGNSKQLYILVSLLGFVFVLGIVSLAAYTFVKSERGTEASLLSRLEDVTSTDTGINNNEVAEQSDSDGSIKGNLSYPSENLVPMKVCAVDTSNSDIKYCIMHEGSDEGTAVDPSFTINVPDGEYYIYADVSENFDGGYIAYSTICDADLLNRGENGTCDDFTANKIVINDGQTADNADIYWGWYVAEDQE